MKLLVGLWNPWEKYARTRHNIGFNIISKRTSRNQLWEWKYEKKYNAEIIQAEYHNQKILLCKPQTFMNLSWEAVVPLARFYKISPKNILVMHDEIDFVTWRIALKFWWSSAGHNWLKSLIEKLWTPEFRRLRIGVDRPAHSSQVIDRVLSSFKPDEKEKLIEKEDSIFKLIDEFLES